MSVPEFQHQAGVYQLTWRDENIYIRVDRVHTEKAGVYGEILIRTTAPGYHPHIYGPIHFNFIGATARPQLVTHLTKIIGLDWNGIIEQTCYKVVEAHRTGEPAINIANHEMPESLGMRITPILQERQATLIFGEGDTLKSFFATFLAVITRLGVNGAGLTPEPGNVLYLDYETDVDTFWERVNMITAGLGESIPDGLYYRHMVEPLIGDLDGVKATTREHGIELVIVDSAAPAVMEPESAEMTTNYFRALRSLNVTSLTIAHMTKQVRGEYPFGSTFWRNLPRSNFQVRADRNSDDVTISLKHTKSNNGRRLNLMGFKFMFQDELVTVHEAKPKDYPDLARDLPLKDQITQSLRSGMKTTEVIAEELDQSQASIRRTLNRHKNLFNKSGDSWGNLHHER